MFCTWHLVSVLRMFHCNTVILAVNADCYSFSVTFSLPPSRAMTPAEQLDIIRSFDAVESMDDEAVSKRDLEVGIFD